MKNTKTNPSLELVVQVRDSEGRPTGATKVIQSSDASELETFWNRNAGMPKRAKKKQRGKQSAKDDILAKMEGFLKLPKGWDMGDGMPLNQRTYLKGREIIESISDLIKFDAHTTPLAKGSFQIEFKNKKTGYELEIEFVDEHTIVYLLSKNDENIYEEQQIGTDQITRLRQVIERFLKGK